MKEYYIWLLSVMGAANPRSLRLISHFGGIKQAYDALNAGETGFLKAGETRNFKKASLEKAQELVEWCNKRNYNIVTIEDDDYPEQLKHIYNPPILLFTEGDIKGINDSVRINVIGTRKPSEYSFKVAHALCSGLAATGMTIVSGMAVGLDKCSMTSALEQGGKVIGVLACGIDVEYPRGSKIFRKRITESSGVCISELFPRDSTRPAYFQYRNRIMSGLSAGTLIIQAGEISGCHITAMHAIAQNRDLFCVPPNDIFDPRYFGVIRYLRDGAIPVFNHIDIIKEYIPDITETLETEPVSASPHNIERDTSVAPSRKSIIPQSAPKADYTALNEEQSKIIEALKKKKLTFDDIVKKKLCTPDKAYEILLDMELDGLIERVAGDKFQLTK
ncbi:MAG: DNA-protecting protein DprA [Oscillospiraceae bacterium]|nr:DNA-protecting protein DprA [Oscillospiraceae bacterium]